MADFKRQATADLMQATLAGDIQAINKAVAMGADLDTQDSQGRTPLAAAAASNNLQALNRLLQHGAKASTRGGDGHSALFAAVSQGAQGTAKRLLQWGDSDPEELAAAAELAVQRGLLPLAALLLKRLTQDDAQRASVVLQSLTQDPAQAQPLDQAILAAWSADLDGQQQQQAELQARRKEVEDQQQQLQALVHRVAQAASAGQAGRRR